VLRPRKSSGAILLHVKTARFADVVKKCGKPEAHLLLIEPAKDRELQAAIQAHRVMTVFQEAAGHKADRGEVGFQPGPARQFLIFPKALRAFEGRNVVGIKYDLWSHEEPPKSERAVLRPKPAAKKRLPPKLPAGVLMFPKLMEDKSRVAIERAEAKPRLPGPSAKKKALSENQSPSARHKEREHAASAKPAKLQVHHRRKPAKESKAAAHHDSEKPAPVADEIAELKMKVRNAIDLLEEGKQVAAFHALKRIVAG
jgi:hypothetical protein